MKKQPERTAKTRQKLVDAFWKLYCEKPIEKITIKDITTEAGYYRSTFYEYFADVYMILDEIEAELIADYQDMIDRLLTVNDLSAAQTLIVSFYETHGEYVAVLLGSDGDQKFYNSLSKMIKNTVFHRIGLDEEDFQTKILLEVLPASVIALLNYWYKHRDTVSIQSVLMVGSELMQNGPLTLLQNGNIPFLK